MAANEIAERLAAACWVQCGSDGGEGGPNYLSNDQIRYRSYVGFQNRIITTTDASLVPVIVLPLDRTLSRSECAVFAQRVGTVGPNDTPLTYRDTYPQYDAAAATYAQCFAQPIMLSWMGDDLSTPLYYPFGLYPGPIAVPDGEDLDTFDAIAIVLPAELGLAYSGDVSVLVLKHPKIEGTTTIEAVLPAEAP